MNGDAIHEPELPPTIAAFSARVDLELKKGETRSVTDETDKRLAQTSNIACKKSQGTLLAGGGTSYGACVLVLLA